LNAQCHILIGVLCQTEVQIDIHIYWTIDISTVSIYSNHTFEPYKNGDNHSTGFA